MLDGLRHSNSGLSGDKRALQSDVRSLQADVDTADSLVRAKAPELIGGRLTGQRVVVVLAPGADPRTADQIGTTVTSAGGALAERLTLQPKLLDPASTQLVQDLVASVLPAGVKLPTDSAAAQAGAVLGAALLGRPGTTAVPADAAQQVVSAFQEAGLVDLPGAGTAITAGTLAVLVAAPAPGRPLDAGARRAQDALLAIASELQSRGAGLVVAGPAASADNGGLVRALRSDSARGSVISSVDNADHGVGQVAVALALREQALGGAGRYGSAPGATGAAPPTAPTPQSPAASG